MFHTFLRGLSRRQLPPQEISPWPCLGFAQHSAERKVLAMQSNLLPEIVAQPSLEKVNVSKNGMAGDLAPVATALSARPQASKLKHFTASGNSFTGPIPPELSKLGVFTEQPTVEDGSILPNILDLSNNSLSGPLPESLYNSIAPTLVRAHKVVCRGFLNKEHSNCNRTHPSMQSCRPS
jgi:hypothetical protein